MTARRQTARVGDRQVDAFVTDAGLDVDGRLVSWLDVDDLIEGDHRVELMLANDERLELRALGATHDQFLDDLRRARRAVRFPALTVATGEPIRSFLSRDPSGPIDVHVFSKVVVLEPREGRPDAIPLSLLADLRRSGHTITLHCRGRADASIRALGARTDEFVDVLERACVDQRAATAAAYAALDPGLEGCTAPDGWAFTLTERPAAWSTLVVLARQGARADEMELLRQLAGDDLALGVYTGDTEPLPFALARVGDRIAVEAFTADDRATFVFATDDVAALNAVLLLTSFRRDALALPDDQLGRWAVAVRTWPAVQQARRMLVSRVVHGPRWAEGVRTALLA